MEYKAGDHLAYMLVSSGGNWLCHDNAGDIASELQDIANEEEVQEIPEDMAAVVDMVSGLKPGDELRFGGWKVQAVLVDLEWMRNLPEHDGW